MPAFAHTGIASIGLLVIGGIRAAAGAVAKRLRR